MYVKMKLFIVDNVFKLIYFMFCFFMLRKIIKLICYYYFLKDKFYILIKYCCLSLKKKIINKKIKVVNRVKYIFFIKLFLIKLF